MTFEAARGRNGLVNDGGGGQAGIGAGRSTTHYRHIVSYFTYIMGSIC